MALYRILALDGGGSWALIQVKALIDIYGPETRGLEVLGEFDLAAANSGGSLTLGGLIENLQLADILRYFEDAMLRASVFHRNGSLARWFSDLTSIRFGPIYSTSQKLAGIEALMPNAGGRQMTALAQYVVDTLRATGHPEVTSSPDFVICAFDYDRLRETFFRSNPQSSAASGAPNLNPTLAEAIHASSNAPIFFFDAPAQLVGHRYWDGAVGGYNNPVLAAVAEAVANGTPLGTIRVLSLGTANVFLPMASGAAGEDSNLVKPAEATGEFHDIKELATAIVDDPPDAASFLAYLMLGGRTPGPRDPIPLTEVPIVRMNPLIQPVRSDEAEAWRAPSGLSSADIAALAALDMDATADADVARIAALADNWIDPPPVLTPSPDPAPHPVRNQPIRANSATLECEIGHWTYAEAKAAWQRFRPP